MDCQRINLCLSDIVVEENRENFKLDNNVVYYMFTSKLRKDEWRFPERNIYAEKSIMCYECGKFIVEVVTTPESSETKAYLAENEYVISGKHRYCIKCYKEKVEKRE